eukprot:CAMPEP_0198254216 /NCGR_PEP_ID=MMETSP1447-20131203/4558_1 /TAXON_ID=420782 /ORGANISM="Chaetoceros dichaeta, Strain CCMP1751" /LENGTH=523 /DNA_ID=CAMNT_0043940183 /DNA_START=24 /DNA_END=1595 /DNA_ORIENTATION=-
MTIIHTTKVLAAVVLYARIATAQNYRDSSRLQIQVPSSLFKSGGYAHRGARFGAPPYGATIMQPLYYADATLCDANVDKRKGYPTRSTVDGQMEPWPSPFILMMDRGGCSFVQKVRNAQHAGAAGVIIADNSCLCSDEECLNSTDSTISCEENEPMMSDDGSGGDIDIPAFLMFKHDADVIKREVIDNNQFIQVEMAWALPRAEDHVDYEIWTSPSDDISKNFLKNWKSVASKFSDHTNFTPHQYIFSGVKKCVDAQGTNLCGNLCTNNGRYCSLDPDGDTNVGISGADVVVESLRRICTWMHYGSSNTSGEKYWDYISGFMDRCDNPELFSQQSCVDGVFKNVGIDGKIINSCMMDSGGTGAGEKGHNKNILLDKEIVEMEETSVIVVPSIFVNTIFLRGSLTVVNVFNAICAGFLEGNAPELCEACSDCTEKTACLEDGFCASNNSESGGGVSKRFFGFTLLLLCSIFGAIAFVHWKKTREEMRDQVRIILADYMPLNDGDDDDQSPMDFARGGGSASLIG